MDEVAEARRQPRPAVQVAVVLERRARPNRWEDWGFTLVDVVQHVDAFGTEPRVLRDDGTTRQTLYPGFTVELYADEAKGYLLNLTSGHPVWFVMWRIDDNDPSRAWPEIVTLSHVEADRWMSANERVDNVPLPADFVEWLQVFTDANFKPEVGHKQRAQSFLRPEDRLKG